MIFLIVIALNLIYNCIKIFFNKLNNFLESQFTPPSWVAYLYFTKQYEAVLNWQTQNANGQNQALHHLGKKIDKVASQVSQIETKVDTINARLEQIYSNLQNRISELDIDLRTMINNRIWVRNSIKRSKD